MQLWAIIYLAAAFGPIFYQDRQLLTYIYQNLQLLTIFVQGPEAVGPASGHIHAWI
jgi:hypothetical protein